MRVRHPDPSRPGRGGRAHGPVPRAPAARAGARLGRRLAQVTVLLAALACLPAAHAEGPLLWVTPMPTGAATLASDGTVRLHRADGSVTRLARGVRGDSLSLCGDTLLAVDRNGSLRSLTSAARGPAVSPHSRPACLPDGRVVAVSSDARSVLLLSAGLQVVARQALDALPDGDPIPLSHAVAVLSQPTQRYRHGVLGDEIEAGAVTLLAQGDLTPIASYSVAPPAVIEQRRVAPFPAAGPGGMLITRSTPERGAGVVALALSDGVLGVVASAPPVGASDRWLNLFATEGDHAYSVRTPDRGGPLERYALRGGKLEVSGFALDVSNHALGSRNLDLATLLPPPPGGTPPAGGALQGRNVDVLALPRAGRRQVQLVACRPTACVPQLELSLKAPLSSNLTARWRGDALILYAGEKDGGLQRFRLDASLWRSASPAPTPVP